MSQARVIKETNTNDPFHILMTFVHENPVAMMCTLQGSLITSRPMFTLEESNNNTLLFLTAAPSVVENSVVTLCYSSPQRNQYLVVQGKASLSRERTYIQKLWKEGFQKWFKEGFNDANLSVLRITPIEIDFWNDLEHQRFPISEDTLATARKSYDAKLSVVSSPTDMKVSDSRPTSDGATHRKDANPPENDPDVAEGISMANQRVPQQQAKVSKESDQDYTAMDEAEKDEANTGADDNEEVKTAILGQEISQGG